MPCTGPDLKKARETGMKVGEGLLTKLLKDHDLTHQDFVLPNSGKRWEAAKTKFVTAVGDLFEENAANGF